jgi:hypothetical protein
MKYRELTPDEVKAYNIGYKVGNRQMVITDVKWESENEHKIYRKGYMAGLMDFKRNVSNVSNVSNVNNVDMIGISISKGDKGDSNIGGMGGKEKGGKGGQQCQQCQQCQHPTLEEVLDYARKQDDMKGCGGYACSDNEAIQFWLKCQNNHWKESNEYRTPILDWEKALKYQNDKKYLLWVDVDGVAGNWNVLADAFKLGKINSGDITEKKLYDCSKMLVEILSGLILNQETKESTLKELEERDYDLWRWAIHRVDVVLCRSKFLRGETDHKYRFDISFLLNKNNFKEIISPNSEKYIDRE